MDKLKSFLYGSPVFIAILYLVFGCIWIIYSDSWVYSAFSDPTVITQVQTYKGFGFVFLTATLLYALIQKNNLFLNDLFSTLEEKDKSLTAAFSQNLVGIVQHREDESWVRVSEYLAKLFGYTVEEFHNLKFEDLIHPDDIHTGRIKDRQLLNGELSSYTDEKRYQHKNGHYINGLLTKSVSWTGKNNRPVFTCIIQDITERKLNEELLKKGLERKEQLLAEIHHRVKNNLALIFAFMQLQMIHEDDERLAFLLKNNILRVKALALLYDALEDSELPNTILFHKYADTLIDHIFDNMKSEYPGIRIKKNIQPAVMNINYASPCGLILTELIINALEHAFIKKDGDNTINVMISRNDNDVLLSVGDNGIELPDEINFNAPDTLGFTIVKSLANQIDADLHFKADHQQKEWLISFQHDKNKKGSSGSLLN
jgi:PAS domain S-box-containing protein